LLGYLYFSHLLYYYYYFGWSGFFYLFHLFISIITHITYIRCISIINLDVQAQVLKAGAWTSYIRHSLLKTTSTNNSRLHNPANKRMSNTSLDFTVQMRHQTKTNTEKTRSNQHKPPLFTESSTRLTSSPDSSPALILLIYQQCFHLLTYCKNRPIVVL
jgi:hypothetical protein